MEKAGLCCSRNVVGSFGYPASLRGREQRGWIQIPGCRPRTDDGPCRTSCWRVTSLAYSMNRFGPFTEPCGTLNFNVKTADSLRLAQTIWVYSCKKSASQLIALPHTLKRRRMTSWRIQWSTVPNQSWLEDRKEIVLADVARDSCIHNSLDKSWKVSLFTLFLYVCRSTGVDDRKRLSAEPDLSWEGMFHLMSVIETDIKRAARGHQQQYYSLTQSLPADGVCIEIIT